MKVAGRGCRWRFKVWRSARLLANAEGSSWTFRLQLSSRMLRWRYRLPGKATVVCDNLKVDAELQVAGRGS